MIKPMLACGVVPDLADLNYPVIMSPKLDGIRCLMVDGIAYSRTGKLIPNRHVQRMAQLHELDGLDGELMLNGDFNDVQSAIMTIKGEPDFRYVVFDAYKAEGPYITRMTDLQHTPKRADFVEVVESVLIRNANRAKYWWNEWVKQGYEGAIVRAPNAEYKNGRSTLKEGGMLKLKHFIDAEALVIDMDELIRKDGSAGDTLGALVVQFEGIEFNIGTGFTEAQRKEIWEGDTINKLAKFKYQELSKKGVPRFPSFIGFRHKDDT